MTTATLPIPKTSEELAEMLADGKQMAKLLETPETLGTFIDSYAREQQGDGTEMNRQVREATQQEFAKLLKDNGLNNEASDNIRRLNLDPQHGTQNMLSTAKKGAAYNAAAPGAVLDGRFKNSVEYFKALWHLDNSTEAREKRAVIQNAFGSTSPADGGFLVPERLRSQLLSIALETAVVRPRATVIPMDSARVPFPMIDSTTNQGSLFGGMIAYWGAEGASLTDSSAKFSQVVLDAHKLTGLSAVPNELLQDSIISFVALVEQLWPEVISFNEDIAFCSGDGVGQPLGFMSSKNTANIAVGAESGQATGTILIENIIKMYSRLLPSSINRSAWIVCPDAIPQLYTMALSVGTGGAPVMLLNAAENGPMTMLGRPIIISEKAGTLGSQSDVNLVDLTYYLVGDRQAMSVTSSTDYLFGSDKTTWRVIQRVDGRPWVQSPITPANGGSTLSPFVQLAARP